MIQTDKTLVEVIEDPLISDRYVDFTNDETAGAISTFIGVTRNNFNNKEVFPYFIWREVKCWTCCNDPNGQDSSGGDRGPADI
mmetsp:Transcript_43695/g.72788  ORF Transcript_43695/g.72788 Transcript_43695/m.72788 type:complete len:83 (-) Transcript_43695:87-335(-)